jgi:hypothetical protein
MIELENEDLIGDGDIIICMYEDDEDLPRSKFNEKVKSLYEYMSDKFQNNTVLVLPNSSIRVIEKV